MNLTGLKPVYDRRLKTYKVEVLRDADPLAAHHGFLVFDDATHTLALINAGKLLQGWKPEKIEAVKTWLRGRCPIVCADGRVFYVAIPTD